MGSQVLMIPSFGINWNRKSLLVLLKREPFSQLKFTNFVKLKAKVEFPR